MANDKKRVKQTIKFLKWTKKYNGLWQLICESSNEHMNLDMMKMLTKRLSDESFYEIIFVLLEVHKNEPFIKSVNEALLKDLLIDDLKDGDKNHIIEKLVYYLE